MIRGAVIQRWKCVLHILGRLETPGGGRKYFSKYEDSLERACQNAAHFPTSFTRLWNRQMVAITLENPGASAVCVLFPPLLFLQIDMETYSPIFKKSNVLSICKIEQFQF